MSRFLFVVPPLVGHINPLVGVAVALSSRGHQVAWAGSGQLVPHLAGAQARVFPCDVSPALDAAVTRPPQLRGPAAFKFLWKQVLYPLAEAMVPGVRTAVDQFGPQVVVADQQALAGALLAERAGLPWATSATTSAELTDPLAALPKVEAEVRQLMADLRCRYGDPASTADLRFSPHLVLAFSTRALAGQSCRSGATIRFVGPSLTQRPTHDDDFPWDWLDRTRPTVLVSLGTANVTAAARFLGACAHALESTPDRRAVIADPGRALSSTAVPRTVLVRPTVPMLRLLPQVDAVLCHAGHNTVCEALSHGLPLVVAPIRDDQPIVAQQVVTAGAGVRIRFDRAGSEQIRAALDTVLGEPGYAGAARFIQRSFEAAGGASAAADALQELAAPVPGARLTPERGQRRSP